MIHDYGIILLEDSEFGQYSLGIDNNTGNKILNINLKILGYLILDVSNIRPPLPPFTPWYMFTMMI